MIVEAVVGLITTLVKFIAGLFGAFSMPGWWDDVDDGLSWLAEQAQGWGYWVPWAAFLQAMTFVAAVIGIALVIRLVRIVASFFTAGGGSAA